MFPLGSVLVPGMALPLHVFEPRYRALVDHCLQDVPEFGVVLIQRGSEVGGGDVRSGVGTVARIVEAARFDDGRWALGCVGVRRIRVLSWLPDEPFPRAEVEDWEDDPSETSLDDACARVVAETRRVLALASELGLAVPSATFVVADEPVLASYQLAAAAPVGPADRYDLLCAAGPHSRLDALTTALADQSELLSAQLAMAGDGEPDDDDLGDGI